MSGHGSMTARGLATTAFAVLLAGAAFVAGACSDDAGTNVAPKPPGTGGTETGLAGSGGEAGSSGSSGTGGGGTGGTTAGTSGGGGTGGTEMPDASYGPSNCESPPDAGVEFLDAGVALLPDGGDGGTTLSYATDIHPIFTARCTPCHATEYSGGHNVAAADVKVSYCYAIQLAADILILVNGGGMPPSYADPPNNCMGGLDSPGCVTSAEFDKIQRWIEQGYPR